MSKRWGQAILDRDEQRAMKRQAVLVAGARLFHEKGYNQTSLDDIAKLLGVTKPSLYYYVKNKEEILFEVVSTSLARTDEAFRRAAATGADGLHKVLSFFEDYARHLHDDFGRCAASVEIHSLEAGPRTKIIEARREIDRQVRALVAEGQQDGSIGPGDPRLLTAYLFGAFNWIAQWQRKRDDAALKEVLEAFGAFSRNAMEPRRH